MWGPRAERVPKETFQGLSVWEWIPLVSVNAADCTTERPQAAGGLYIVLYTVLLLFYFLSFVLFLTYKNDTDDMEQTPLTLIQDDFQGFRDRAINAGFEIKQGYIFLEGWGKQPLPALVISLKRGSRPMLLSALALGQLGPQGCGAVML